MELARAYKFRIYPDAKRQEEIDERLILAQQFYNRILAIGFWVIFLLSVRWILRDFRRKQLLRQKPLR